MMSKNVKDWIAVNFGMLILAATAFLLVMSLNLGNTTCR